MTAFAGISQELHGNFAVVSRKLLAHRVGASRPDPNPDPFPRHPTPLALRRAVLPTDMTRSRVLNSQFFASISSCSKVGAGDPYLAHIVMGGE